MQPLTHEVENVFIERQPLLCQPPRFAGVHLSGPNAHKTALVMLEGHPLDKPLKIGKVYEKIGSFGTLFSDERLVEILTYAGPFAEVFVDCPLSVPPCVSCQRSECPGAVQCEDVSVAYMLAISSKIRRRGARKARPINPQSQRLWDVLQLDGSGLERMEPSYSSNLAPLVTRARTLQRRLNAADPKIELKETSIANALEAVRQSLKLPLSIRYDYRSFEEGSSKRRLILERMVDRGWLVADWHAEVVEMVIRSVETFNAFLASWVGALHHAGLTSARPLSYVDGEGWVFLPEVISKVDQPITVAE